MCGKDEGRRERRGDGERNKEFREARVAVELFPELSIDSKP